HGPTAHRRETRPPVGPAAVMLRGGMSGSSDGARIPARDLWVRLRADGRVLLELVGRRDVRLCSAVSIAEDAEEIAEILVSWACDAGGPGGTWSPELLQADAEAFSRPSHRALFI